MCTWERKICQTGPIFKKSTKDNKKSSNSKSNKPKRISSL